MRGTALSDPLAGKREAINAGEREVLTWPDEGQGAPVKVGDVFKLRTCHIEITSTQRVGGKGRPWVWRATFARSYSDERLHLLGKRSIVHDPKMALKADDDPHASTLDRIHPDDRSEEHKAEGEAPEPEGVPMHEVKNLPTTVAAQRRYEELHLEDIEKRLDRSMTSKLREVRIRAREAGVDVSTEMELISAATEKARRKVKRAA